MRGVTKCEHPAPARHVRLPGGSEVGVHSTLAVERHQRREHVSKEKPLVIVCRHGGMREIDRVGDGYRERLLGLTGTGGEDAGTSGCGLEGWRRSPVAATRDCD